MTPYEQFIATKRRRAMPHGFEPTYYPDKAFDFQREIIARAVRAGRYAIYADCGLGKTLMQLAWAENVTRHTNGNVLIVTPLSVAHQTVADGLKFGISATYRRDGIAERLTVTNYEHVHKFSPRDFVGIVVDESSILKSFTGAFRIMLTDFAHGLDYRLSCSATPAPNDFMEYGTQSEFLGQMRNADMTATFFVHDGGDTSKWRLKRHAVRDFRAWLDSWSCHVTLPSDIGYSDDGYVLPPLHEHTIRVEGGESEQLFEGAALSLHEQRALKKRMMEYTVPAIATLINNDLEQWIVWIENNYEGDALKAAIPHAVEVRGSDDPDFKERTLEAFASGDVRVLITKASIAGFGLNWQQCHKMVFASSSHSYEQYYQAVRRCYRFGQSQPVEVYRVRYFGDEAVAANFSRKQSQAKQIKEGNPV